MKISPIISAAGFRRAVIVIAAVLSAAVLGGVSVLAGTTNYFWNNTGADFYTNDLDWVSNVAPMGVLNTLGPKGSVNYAANITNGGTINYGDGGGGPSTGYTWTNVLGSLLIAPNASGSGTFNMTSDSLVVSNTGASELVLGGGANSTASMTMSGGTLTTVRNSATMFQDFFLVGNGAGANATFTLGGGILTNLSGIEIGDSGTGTFNVSGGELIDNGWFGVGRGGSGNSAGTFNLSGGTVYILRNVGTDGGDNGVYLGQGATNSSIANISGGSLYCIGIGMGGGGAQSSQFLNVSAGTLYIGSRGVGNNGSGSHFSTISGGTFHTLGMFTNTAANQGNLGSILSNGTNWTWATTPAVNLTNTAYTVNGVSGPGFVTFAPEATRTITLNNSWFGVGGITAVGPGTVAFGGGNLLNFTGPLTINGGIVALTGANTFGTPVILNTGGVLAVGAVQNDTNGITINGGNIAILNGGSLLDSTLDLPAGSSLIFTNTSPITLTNVITGPGNVLVNNTGVVNLGSNVQNTGTVTQNNGVLVLGGTISIPGSITNSGPASVGPMLLQGDVMSPIGIGTNSSLEAGTAIQPGTGLASNVVLNGTWIEKLNTATTVGGGVNDLLICSNLTLNPSSVLLITPETAPSMGSYVIAEYSGLLTGKFGTTNNGTGDAMSLDYSTQGEIILNVNSVNQSSLAWTATNLSPNINWDVNTSSNWTNSATSALSTFHQQDAVKFNAVPGAGITNRVSVTGQIMPSSINISGGLPYLFSGTGYISGGTGINYSDTNVSGIYTFGNNFTGSVYINAGVLQLGGGGSSWLGVSNITTVSGGTLDLNAQGVGAEPLVIQGTGSSTTGTNTGAINNSASTSPGQSAGPLNITLTGDTTLNASGNRWDIGVASLGAGGGSFVGNDHNLTKIGNQAIWMHELGDIGVGSIDIQQGLLGFEFTIGMGNSSSNVTVEPGATLGFFQLSSNSILNKQMVLNGNATLQSGGSAGSSNNFAGPITLNGTNSIQTSIFPLNLTGNITGPGGFNLSGTGPLYLGGVDAYNGSTFIAANSVLSLEAGGSIPNTPLIYMTPGSNTVINASGAGSMTLNSGQTLEGSGSVAGNFNANSGSVIFLGTNATTYGTIVFTNNLTLNGDTNDLKISDNNNVGVDNDLISVVQNLTLSGVSTFVVSPLAALNTGNPYVLIDVDGAISGTVGNVQIISPSPRYTMTPVIGTDINNHQALMVTIMGNAAPLEWEGYLTPNWDLVTSNWFNMGTATHDHFYTGDNPTFDDTASVTGVIVTNNVIVSGMNMSNVVKTYTFSGVGVITGPLNMEGNGNGNGGMVVLGTSNAPAFTAIDASAGTLVYNLPGLTNYTVAAGIVDNLGLGSGTLIFGGTNTAQLLGDNVPAPNILGSYNPDFDGTIIVTNGILQYTNVNSLGVDASVNDNPSFSPLIITNNGTLNFNGVPAGPANAAPLGGEKWIHISGSGFNGQGALTDSANNQEPNGAFCNLYLDGNATINIATARVDQHVLTTSPMQQVEGNGYNLTIKGGGAFFFNPQADGDTHLGNIDVACTNGGRLAFQGGPDALGVTTNYLTIEPGAEVTFYNFSNNLDTVHLGVQKNVWLKGGNAAIDSAGNGGTESNNFDGPIFLTGTNLIGTRYDMHVWGSIMDSNSSGGFILGNDSVGASGAALWLDGTNTYSGPTIISNQTLYVGVNSSLGLSRYVQVNSGATLDLSATLAYNFGTVQTNQTMAGNGTVKGPATGNLNFTAGGTLAIGLPTTNGVPNTNTFTLTIDNNVVFDAGSTNYVVANKTSAAAGAVPVDNLSGPTSLTLGGTVVITNYGGKPFVAGDTLALYSATAISTNSGFNIVPATPGPNLAWNISTIPANGMLSVVSTVVVNPNPTNILFSVSPGNQLTLSWPADHTGWELEIQTNSLSVGISNNWVAYPASTTVDSITIPINLSNGTVFYRLVYPPQ